MFQNTELMGQFRLGYANPWEKGLTDAFLAAQEVGLGVKTDVNSGNTNGV